jgi:hypothetical protein
MFGSRYILHRLSTFANCNSRSVEASVRQTEREMNLVHYAALYRNRLFVAAICAPAMEVRIVSSRSELQAKHSPQSSSPLDAN